MLDLAAWQGDLGLSSGRPQSVYTLPVAQLKNIGTTQLTPGKSWKMKDGTTVTFVSVQQWATFQVAHDPGTTIVLVAAGFIVAGLLCSLRVRRRRLWVRARPAADGTAVRLPWLKRGASRAATPTASPRSSPESLTSAREPAEGLTLTVAANATLAHLSDVLFTWTVFVYAVAMLGYAIEFAFARIARARSEDPVKSVPCRPGSGRLLTVVGWGLHVELASSPADLPRTGCRGATCSSSPRWSRSSR